MALEAIGLGFGAASFAADLTVAIFKLKQLWNEVKEVPDEVESILENLEAVGLTLKNLEKQLSHDAIPPELRDHVLSSPLRFARRAHTSLQEVIDTLNTELRGSKGIRKRFTSVKAVLRKPTLQQLERKLKFALNTLLLAVQNFELALIMDTRQLVIDRMPLPYPNSFPTAIVPSTKLAAKSHVVESDYGSKRSRKYHKRNLRSSSAINTAAVWLGRVHCSFGSSGQYQFVIRTPSWLAGSVHVAIAERSLQGWQVNICTYCVIGDWDDVAGDEIGFAFENDDPAALRRILQDRGLPLLTRDEGGLSLPLLAISFCSARILRELFDLGVGLDHSEYSSLLSTILEKNNLEENHTIDARDIFMWVVLCSEKFGDFTGLDLSQARRLETMKAFAAQSSMDDVLSTSGLEVFVGLLQLSPASHLKLYQQWFLPNLSLAERLKCARHIPLRNIELSSRVEELRILVPELWTTQIEEPTRSVPSCTKFLGHERHFALHLAAREKGLAHSSSVVESDHDLWSQLLRDLLRSEAADNQLLEPYSTYGAADHYASQTPFLTYLSAAMDAHLADRKPVHTMEASLAEALPTWLNLVKEAGVDLRAYGSGEKLICDYIRGCTKFSYTVDHLARCEHMRLISLSYGAEPADWKLWWAPEYEELEGRFWEMIEDPHLSLPGGWVEESEIDRNDGGWIGSVEDTFNWVEV